MGNKWEKGGGGVWLKVACYSYVNINIYNAFYANTMLFSSLGLLISLMSYCQLFYR